MLSIQFAALKVAIAYATHCHLRGAIVSRPQPLVDAAPAWRLVKGQVVMAVMITLLAMVSSAQSGLSAGVGAGIAVAGSAYFASQAFRHAGAASARQIVKSFYKGAAGKFGLTVLLFAAAFGMIPDLRAGWVLTGFFLVQLVAWLSPLRDALRDGS